MERPLYASEETLLLFRSAEARFTELERLVTDHEHRFDTLQTPWPKRVWFWLDGWPWHDLNGRRQRRPWRKGWRWRW